MARYDWPRAMRNRDNPTARAEHLARFVPHVDPSSITAPAPTTAKRATRRRRATPKNLPVGSQNLWFPIGPTVMTNGQASGNPNVAGRIRDLQVEPVSGLRLYAGSAGGGVWFSADRGETWRPLDDYQISDRSDIGNVADALSVGAVHVIWGAAADGSDDVVWVGTGEQELTGDGLNADRTTGLPGSKMYGIGFLNSDPAIAGGAWTVVKGAAFSADHDTLRGEAFCRIGADPGDPTQLVAATTRGLYVRPSGAGQTWTRVAGYTVPPAVIPLDVVLTRTPANVLRIWVAAASDLQVAEVAGAAPTPVTPASLTFAPVKLPDVVVNKPEPGQPLRPGGTRLQLATDGTKLYVLGRAEIPAKSSRTTPPAALWTVDVTATLAKLANGTATTRLQDMAEDLFMSSSDQSYYDMCITCHPTVAGRVYVGGAVANDDGAVYRCDTTATSAKPTLIGDGVHPDVHVLRVGPVSPTDATKRTVWIGCDGGLFRSDSDGDAGTFVNRNDGLAVLQPGFVACHPTNPGVVVAGFQDNGTAIRTGDTVWTQKLRGDGGGVAFDPNSTNRFFRQYVHVAWESSDGGGISPVNRRNARGHEKVKSSETIESDSSFFYSGASALKDGTDSHLVFGSNRVWYSPDWGRSWMTLPTASDPRAGDNPDLKQDVLDLDKDAVNYSDTVGSTDSCSSTYPGVGYTGAKVLTVKLSLSADRLTLRAIALHERGVAWMIGTRAAASGPYAWQKNLIPRQAIKDPQAGAEQTAFADGSPMAFLPAAGVVSDLAVHDHTRGTLGSCYVTTIGGFAGGAARDTLWFFDGTGTWRPTGLHHATTVVNGTWAVPADRVTAPALAVIVDPGSPNVVYVGTSVGVVRGVLTIGGTPAAPTYAWAWEQLMNGLPEAAVQDLAIYTGSGPSLLRAATQARGVWELDLSNSSNFPLTYLRMFRTDTRRVLPTPLGGDVLNGEVNNPVHWDDSPDVVIDTTGVTPVGPLTEARLDKIARPGPPAGPARTSTDGRHPKVHVLVHHRWSDPLPPNQVKVALLRHDLPNNGAAPVALLWPALIAASGSNAQPASLPDGWTKAGSAVWQRPTDAIDQRVPRAVTFDVDLSSDQRGASIVLLAVVMSDSNQISDKDRDLGGGNKATTVDQLVVASPHAAAVSLFIE